jgi:hypothetical protein
MEKIEDNSIHLTKKMIEMDCLFFYNQSYILKISRFFLTSNL